MSIISMLQTHRFEKKLACSTQSKQFQIELLYRYKKAKTSRITVLNIGNCTRIIQFKWSLYFEQIRLLNIDFALYNPTSDLLSDCPTGCKRLLVPCNDNVATYLGPSDVLSKRRPHWHESGSDQQRNSKFQQCREHDVLGGNRGEIQAFYNVAKIRRLQ